MRYLIIVFILSTGVIKINAQEVQAENILKEHSKLLHEDKKSVDHDLIHKFICQRCGSENITDWTFTTTKNLQLIPHCNFCGKKYWPKFKPSGFLERTYSTRKSKVPESS